ncbi:MAG: radical SAM protein [Candidatus Hermodarchaeota archaeon]
MSNLQNPHYDAYLHLITTYQCNLECNYCEATQYGANPSVLSTKTYPINISALKNTLDNSNKIYRINFTGGEPFLVPNVVEACIELTKKHFISINTNLTSKKVKEFAEKITPERVLFINASCHIKELERRNLLSRYIDNFLLCKNRGFNIGAIEVGYPQLLKEVDKYIKFFLEKGIELAYWVYVGRYKGKFYPDSYSEKERKTLGLTEKYIGWFHQYGKLCNVGYNVGIIHPNGDTSYCFAINKSLGNIYERIKFNDKLIRCPAKLCTCPMNMYDPYLFRKAINEVGSYDAEWIQPIKNRIREYVKSFLFEGKQYYRTNNTRRLIIEKVMQNKFSRKFLLKYWI